MVTPDEVVEYWVRDVGPKGWYGGDADLDAQVAARFKDTWQEARGGACGLWLTSPVGVLGYLILTDQMPRNMFRDHADAFATDASARAAAKAAISKEWDLRIAEPERQFFYLPLMHSENLVDQDRCVRLMKDRLSGEAGASNLRHARAHRDVIRQFGRFPYRNEAFGRTTTKGEAAWMAAGGYGLTLKMLKDAEAS